MIEILFVLHWFIFLLFVCSGFEWRRAATDEASLLLRRVKTNLSIPVYFFSDVHCNFCIMENKCDKSSSSGFICEFYTMWSPLELWNVCPVNNSYHTIYLPTVRLDFMIFSSYSYFRFQTDHVRFIFFCLFIFS